jgi:hypothetical protein
VWAALQVHLELDGDAEEGGGRASGTPAVIQQRRFYVMNDYISHSGLAHMQYTAFFNRCRLDGTRVMVGVPSSTEGRKPRGKYGLSGTLWMHWQGQTGGVRAGDVCDTGPWLGLPCGSPVHAGWMQMQDATEGLEGVRVLDTPTTAPLSRNTRRMSPVVLASQVARTPHRTELNV